MDIIKISICVEVLAGSVFKNATPVLCSYAAFSCTRLARPEWLEDGLWEQIMLVIT
jgi:hypothetical protein